MKIASALVVRLRGFVRGDFHVGTLAQHLDYS